MNIEELREYCLSKKGATEDMPFDDKILVFKIGNKMFALTNLEEELKVNLKFDPEKVIERIEEFSFVIPAFHMSKKHWATVECTTKSDSKLIKRWIDESYDLVLNKLTKKVRLEIL